MRNKAFTRQCCACRCHKEKKELIRLVAKNGEVVIDVDSNIQGRGVYICKDANCIKIAKKKNIINKSLKTVNNMDIYDKVITLIENE
ncbi:MAG: YlxR family protein [Clostridia bacterium]|nr:YlxR family protein [Clostridia bacterium]